MKNMLVTAALFLAAFPIVYVQKDAPSRSNDVWLVQERNVRAHLEFLASDALKGRGSGTEYELIAAQYIASQLRQFGIASAGDAEASGQKSFLQTITLAKRTFAEAPRLIFNFDGKATVWTHGVEFVLSRASAEEFSGPLQKMEFDGQLRQGAIVLIKFPEDIKSREQNRQMRAMLSKGATAVLAALPFESQQRWPVLASRKPELPMTSDSSSNSGSIIYLSAEAAQALQQIPNGTPIRINGKLNPPENLYTWNVVGELRGSDPTLTHEVVLLSAHLDHLGVYRAVAGDSIYNGADDDASGVVAVLELARILAMGPKPKRTVYFALFGSEERGGYGSQYFIKNPPVPLSNIVADLQFEMIGRPDPKIPANTLWLTGYERSNLGPGLTKHGARLVADPHPEENFFQRSDNFAFAQLGVIAHTVSSYGLHQEYHQPNDDLAHMDFAHITNAVNSMIKPVQWLVNSNFTPTWVEGKKP
jgi:Peptidase family M28